MDVHAADQPAAGEPPADAKTQQARLLQVGQNGAPPLLLIPGALTAAQGLLPVAHVLAQRYRVGVLDVSVPIGGGDCFTLPQAVTLAANAVHHLAERDAEKPLVIGESAGGLIGLELARTHPALLAGLVLADPPLAPAKLWHVRAAMQQAISPAPAAELTLTVRFFADYARELFGYAVAAGETDTEPLYFDAVAQCHAPVLILTGEEPLWPMRQSARVPCCLDALDSWVLERIGKSVSVQRLPGGDHILLRRHPQESLDMIAEWADRAMCVTGSDVW
ncbi:MULTISPECIES: alpha/beta fold hydrolase [Thiorhodovibrio]|uniref:alpha/beta fold hydrolase n=1 Tax=Thiorhodovibrio TaxID=61593 RepID=UPI00191245B0|nr:MULTISPECIES: alpha/beta hydrolase [Thiorhodovibrio]WPL15031.1 pyrimidine utilization protein D [Thiorhodovibrio litoralis]